MKRSEALVSAKWMDKGNRLSWNQDDSWVSKLGSLVLGEHHSLRQ